MTKPIGITKLRSILQRAGPRYQNMIGETLSGETLTAFFGVMAEVMLKKGTDEQRWAMWACVEQYRKSKLTKLLGSAITCRLAAGLHLIEAGIVPPLWEGNKTEAVMQCIGVSPDLDSKKKRRLIVHLLCLLGDPAGTTLKTSLSSNMLEYILGKKLGLSYRVYNAAAEEISGCCFKCMVSADSYEAVLSDYDASETMKKMNKALAEARLSLTKCKTASVPCSVCRKTLSECSLAVWR